MGHKERSWACCWLWAAFPGLVMLGILLLRRGASAEPACGQCSYPVRGLSSFTCPECGADLREVGIASDRFRRRFSPGWRVALWTVLLPLPALLASGQVGRLLQIRTATSTLVMPIDTYYDLELVEIGSGYGAGRRLRAITLRLSSFGSSQAQLAIEPRNKSYRVSSSAGGGWQPGLPDGPRLATWARSGGLRWKDAYLRPVADELAALVAADLASGVVRTGTSGLGGRLQSGAKLSMTEAAHTPGWVFAVMVSFWLAVWLWGVRRILEPIRRAREIRSGIADVTPKTAP